MRATNQRSRGPVCTLRRINNDRCEFSRLSKIAHMRRLRQAAEELRCRCRAPQSVCVRTGSFLRDLNHFFRSPQLLKRWAKLVGLSGAGFSRSRSPDCLKTSSHAHSEGAADFVLAASLKRWADTSPKQWFHKSSALCRRSQLPLTSSQPSRARTLARAKAMEQSAAP